MKTRFAPSPTGYLHLGNMRTALFNALIARHAQGVFLLRIEDTDAARSEDLFMHSLMEDLVWLGLQWQEGPVRQSERHDIYNTYYKQLTDKNLAYPCFCSDEHLKLSRKLQVSAGQPPRYDGRCARLTHEEVKAKIAANEAHTLRFKIPVGETVSFKDLVQGDKLFKTDDIGDFIIRREDGSPAFMFCNAIDDALMTVTQAMRGEDHLTNTPRQLLILKALDLPMPQYGHFALITGSDGGPLSKRNGSQSIRDLREQGIWPLALLNYLARLGHSYENNALMTEQELGEQFQIEHLGRAPARFDMNQLLHWQGEVFKSKSTEEIWEWMGEAVHQLVPAEKKQAFVELVAPNVIVKKDALSWAQRAFGHDILFGLEDDSKAVLTETDPSFFRHAKQAIEAHPNDYSAWLNHLKEHSQAKGKQLFQPLRVALMGTLNGPELEKWSTLLGQESIAERFISAQDWK
jgi:nondiscriminating glutamyl-tRNA synthetase